jgi:hypothetical protein
MLESGSKGLRPHSKSRGGCRVCKQRRVKVCMDSPPRITTFISSSHSRCIYISSPILRIKLERRPMSATFGLNLALQINCLTNLNSAMKAAQSAIRANVAMNNAITWMSCLGIGKQDTTQMGVPLPQDTILLLRFRSTALAHLKT